MNGKVLPVLVGLAGLAIGGIPSNANAETTISQMQRQELPLHVHPIPSEMPSLEGIQLTREQQTKIEQIQQETQNELKASGLLPTEMEEALRAANGEMLKLAIARLSEDQQAELAEIAETYRRKVTEVFTPEQQQFLQSAPDVLFDLSNVETTTPH
jgi:Spy/CpxP family protein refolding chaperone